MLAVPGPPDGPARRRLPRRSCATAPRWCAGSTDVIEALGAPAPAPPGGRGSPRGRRRRAPPRPPPDAPPAPPVRRPPATRGDLRARIVDRLGPSPLAEDQLIRDLGLAAPALAPALMDLELEGRVLRQPGGLLALAA